MIHESNKKETIPNYWISTIISFVLLLSLLWLPVISDITFSAIKYPEKEILVNEDTNDVNEDLEEKSVVTIKPRLESEVSDKTSKPKRMTIRPKATTKKIEPKTIVITDGVDSIPDVEEVSMGQGEVIGH